MSSLLNKKWILPINENLGKSLRDRMLQRRKIDNANDFFQPSWIKYLGRFDKLPDINLAVERILRSREKGELIRIFGDYDADGVCATALLFLALREIGCQVDYQLPHRVEDGYGLTAKVIEKCIQDGIGLLLTVDCGVTNIKEIALAREKGLDVIITDHHALTTELPPAIAIINPRRLEDGPEIVGAVVAFRLGEALITKTKGDAEADKWLRWNVDLAALATVADCAPLIGENRTIVFYGLKTIAANQRPGTKVLCELADIDPATIVSEDLGFRLAPRVNAAGRIAHPNDAIYLLLAENTREARKYAEKLQKLNSDRQKLTRNAVESVVTALGDDLTKDALIVHSSSDHHPGIVGLIAGQLCERYGRPTIVCDERDEIIVGSCRSIPSWHIAKALARQADLLERFGGHAQAAGLTVRRENFIEVIERLKQDAQKNLSDIDLRPILEIESQLEAKDLTLQTWKDLQSFEPFGIGNEPPVFYLSEAVIIEAKRVGSTQAHLKMKIIVEKIELGAIFFGGGEFISSLSIGSKCQLAVTLQKHVWNSRADLELQVVDIKV